MSLRNLLTIIFLTTVAGSCAHEPPPPDPYVSKGVAAIDAWLDQLPGCAPSAEKMPTIFSPDATLVEVHSPLTLATNVACTRKQCPGEAQCCNTCMPTWVVVPDASQGPRLELALQKSGAAHPMAATVNDCKLSSLRERIRKPNVIVSGWLEKDPAQPKILRASICVVKPPPAPPQPPAQ